MARVVSSSGTDPPLTDLGGCLLFDQTPKHLAQWFSHIAMPMIALETFTGSMRKRLSKKALARLQKKSDKTAARTKAEDPRIEVPDVRDWYTRNQVVDLLRISPQTIKNYEGRDLLHPKQALRKDRSGIERVMLVYDPKELTELPPRSGAGQPSADTRKPGEQAARAFELFREGKGLDEIVIELRETPERVDQLHEHWLDQTKARYVISPEAKRAFEDIFGEFKSVTDLVELARKFRPA